MFAFAAGSNVSSCSERGSNESCGVCDGDIKEGIGIGVHTTSRPGRWTGIHRT